MSYSNIAIVIPCFNEEHSITSVLKDLAALGINNIIAIDDYSTDNTLAILHEAQNKYNNLTVLHNTQNRGAGFSIMKGLRYAKNNTTAKYVITMDADGQHIIEDIEKIIQATIQNKHDIIYGVRNFHTNIPLTKKISNFLARLTLIILYQNTIQDPYCGLRAFNRQFIDKLKFRNRFEWCVDCAQAIRHCHTKALSVPIKAHYTEYSQNKQSNSLNLKTGSMLFLKLVKDRIYELTAKTQKTQPKYEAETKGTATIAQIS